MAELDVGGLTPLDTTGLSELDVGGLRELDVSGLSEMPAKPRDTFGLMERRDQDRRNALEKPEQTEEDRAIAEFESRPFMERRITDPLARGTRQLQSSMGAAALGPAGQKVRALDIIDRLEARGKPGLNGLRSEAAMEREDAIIPPGVHDPLAFARDTGDPEISRYAVSTNPEERAEIRKRLNSAVRYNVGQIIEGTSKAAAIPKHPAVARAQQAETFDEFWDAFKKAPGTFITDTTLESAPNMLPGLAAGAIGGPVAGRAGFAITTGGGSGIIELGGSINEKLMEFGADMKDPESIKRVLKEHEAEIYDYAMKRAVAVGLFDAVGARIAASKVFPGSPVAEIGAQAAAGSGTGMGGEIAAAGMTGQEQNVGAILSEGLGEIPGQAGEVVVYALTGDPKPAGKLQESAAAVAPLSPADERSPIPNGLIAAGKAVINKATATSDANNILAKAGLPGIGARVRLAYPDGREIGGAVVDGFTTSTQTGASADGVKIKLDNGTMFEEFADTIRTAGVQITPEGAKSSVTPAPGAAPGMVNETAATQGLDTNGVAELNVPHGTDAAIPLQGQDASGETVQQMPGRAGAEEPALGAEVSDPSNAGEPGASQSGLGGVSGVQEGPQAPGAAEGDGTRQSPLKPASAPDVGAAAGIVESEPSDAQINAGNYQKLHVKVHGLDISVENPKGSIRRSKPDSPVKWEVEMPAHYGDIKRTTGADGDNLDVYVGDNLDSGRVFIVDQIDPETGKFDEHKALLGFNSQEEAVAAYDAGFSDGKGPQRRGAVTSTNTVNFKAWLKKGNTTEPIAYKQDGSQANAPAPDRPRTSTDSIYSLVRSLGGVKDDRGDLAAMDLQKLRPGFLNARGISIERLGEKMLEDGYDVAWDFDPDKPDIAKVKELITHELSGTKVYPRGSEAEVRDQRDDEKRRDDHERARLDQELVSILGRDMTDEEWADVNRYYSRDGYESRFEAAIDALESAIIADVISVASEIGESTPTDDIPFEAPDAQKPESRPLDQQGSKPEQEPETAAGEAEADGPGGGEADPDQGGAEPVGRPFPETPTNPAIEAGGSTSNYRRWLQSASDADLQTMLNTGLPGRLAQSELDRRKAKKPDAKTDTDEGPKLANAFFQAFRRGESFATIVEARKFAERITGQKIAPGTPEAKQLEEAIEAGVVLRARELVAEGKEPSETFDRLTALYAQQPKLAERTSTSIENQAYSTPAPLAFLASRLAGIDGETTVYEPTAGNGMLLIAADPANVTANELNPDRAENLLLTVGDKATITLGDAMENTPKGEFDVVIANPPFGKVRDSKGEKKRFPLEGNTTTDIDHAIVWKALKSLAPEGRAALIIGGKRGTREERINDYRATKTMAFFKKLYDTYNVVDHFTADGKLYERQGAAWPVDVIVIDGKGKSSLPLPTKEPPTIFPSWEQLRNKLNDRVEPARQPDGSGEREPAAPAPAAAPAVGVSPAAGRPDQPTDPQDQPGLGSATAAPVRDGGRADAGARDGGRSAGGEQRVAEGESGVPEGTREPAVQEQPGDSRVPGERDAGGVSGDAVPRQRVARKNTEAETAFQVQYEPTSAARFAVGTLVPRNMQTAMKGALAELSERVGDIDTFVAKKLDYTAAELLGTDTQPGYFSAEQVDALALAIDSVEAGAGFIIGDQTGVGKGRFVAAMLRYAQVNNKPPVFITKDPGLYADMVRDLRDIGMPDVSKRILVTNNDLRGATAIPLSADDPTDVLGSLSPAKQAAAMQKIVETGNLPAGYDMLFTTYSQMQYLPQGKTSDRQAAMKSIARNAVIVLDESHEAGGQGEERKRIAKDGTEIKSRADFIREILKDASGAVYSSATYAKNPAVMSLYFKTDLSLAVPKIEELASTIQAGGVPLQQVVANMLVESGQYARRERSFEGVAMDLDVLPTDQKAARAASESLRQIFALDTEYMHGIRQAYANERAAEDGEKGSHDNAVGDAGVQQAGFSSIMHNVISQMLLSLKVQGAIDKAIAQFKAGHKPIIALSNTNEAIIDDFVEDAKVKPGDAVDISFNAILERYVKRLRRVTLKDHDNNKRHFFLRDEDIVRLGGTHALDEVRAVEKAIREVDLGELPGSPIDFIIDKLNAAGIKTGEITGRGSVIRNGVYEVRKASAAEKKKAMNAYNSGGLDALVINRSGSTGFSMHAIAGKKGNDGKRRHMIVLQPDPNIDVFMQMLGRINRTGQTELPGYTIGVSDLAVEKRPAAVLMRKMASLNANTTASKKSAVSLDNVTDFMNRYGDQVVAEYLNENTEIANLTDIRPSKMIDGLASKFSGRLAILPPDQVTAIYADIEAAYKEYIESLDRMGLNALEAKTLELDARTISSEELTPGKGDRPFERPAMVEKVDVLRLGKPYTPDELKAAVAGELGEYDEPLYARVRTNALDDKMDAYRSALEDRAEKARATLRAAKTDAQKEKAQKSLDGWQKDMERADKALDAIKRRIDSFVPGETVILTHGKGDDIVTVPAVALGVDIKRVKDNPTAASNIIARFAIADAGREVRIPLSKMIGDEATYGFNPTEEKEVMQAFERGGQTAREEREIITGNLLTGFNKFRRGQITLFRDNEGNVRQGILMPKGFDSKAALAAKAVQFETAAQVSEFLRAPEARMVKSDDEMLTLTWDRFASEFVINVLVRGGKQYYLQRQVRDLIGDFQQRRGQSTMRNSFTPDKLAGVMAAYKDNLDTVFQTTASKNKARKIVGAGKKPKLKAGGFAKEFVGDINKVADALKQRMRDLGIADRVALGVSNELRVTIERRQFRVQGMYLPGLIEVSLSASDGAFGTLNHEAIHAMRDLNLFTTWEWQTLEKAARNSPIYQRQADSPAYQAKGLNDEELAEETIAEMFREYADRANSAPLTIRGLLARIKNFLQALRDALIGTGYRRAQDVFSRVESGAVGRRQRDAQGRFVGDPMAEIDGHGPMGLSPRFMAYETAPDSLMGFRRNGPGKPYHEQNWKHEQYVKITFPDGQIHYDAMKGLNKPHAIERARRNWPNTKIEEATEAQFDDYIRAEDILLGKPKLSVERRPARPAGAAHSMTFDDAASEARWVEARKGIAGSESLIAKTEEWLAHAWHGFSRHFIDLPNNKRYADLGQQLRKLQAAPQASKEKVVRILRQLTEGMNAKDLDLFTRKVVLDDLSWEVEQEHLLPFGMTPEDVTREKAKIDAIMEQRPDLAEAVRQRKLIIRQVANDLVRIGVLHRDQVKNPAYYRHQVLDYARAVKSYAKGTGKKLRTPYWAKRMGSTLDINANLLEAEFDWLHKAFMGIETVKTIDWIKRSEHNIRRDVIASARAHNDRLIQGMLDDEGDGGPLHDIWKGFRQQIAIGLGKVKKAIEDGDLYVPEEFEDAADNLTGDAANDASIFPFMAWIMDHGDAGAMGAAMVFKGISQRREWVKRVLGSRYADPTNVGELVKRFAPEGYVAWQPDSPDGRGKALRLYVAKTIPEAAIDRMVEKVMRGHDVPAEFAAVIRAGFEAEVKSALTVGSAKYEMVIPEEVASTLNGIQNDFEENIIAHVIETPTRMWKVWTLLNPRRVLKYNLNNLSGDLDAVVAGNPRILLRSKQAAGELYRVMVKKETPTARYNEAVERGVFDSGFTVQEIPDINSLSEFERLIKPMNWKNPAAVTKLALAKGWGFLRGSTTLRENIFRYAAYLDYIERIEAGEPMSKIGYGASKPEIVDAVKGQKDRAALLARDLIGDYGAISQHGQQLRRYLLPFWSFQEINIRRYWRLNANAWSQGVVKGAKTSAVTGAVLGVKTTAWLYLRMFMVYALINIWNNLMWGDDEDDLDPEQRARLHLNLWKNADGSMTTLRIQGSLSDIFGWFGFEDALATMYEVERGRAGLWDILGAMAKAPVNKVVNGITPALKSPIEAAGGVSFFPDVFDPRPVRDNWRQFWRTFSLENEYDAITEAPSRGYGRSWAESVVSTRDPGEAAYGRMKGMAAKWLEREKGQEGYSALSTPRSNALYNLRTAMKYGDRDAERKARQTLRDLGVTQDDIKQSIKRAHPLGSIALKDRAAFLRSLTADERKVLAVATRWYEEVFQD